MQLLEYTIAIVTFVLAGLPMIGVNIRYDKIKNNSFRILFVASLVIAFIVYSFVFFKEKEEEGISKELTENTSNRVETIANQMIQIEVNNTVLESKQDSIIYNLTRLNDYTTAFLDDIIESRKLYDELRFLEEQDLILRKNEFKERRPVIKMISGDASFIYSNDSTTLDLQFIIRNNGGRGVNKAEAISLLILTDSIGSPIYHLESTHVLGGGLDSKLQYNGYIREVNLDIFKQAVVGVLIVNVSATDSVTGERIEELSVITWNSEKESFFSYKHSDDDVLNNYIRKNNLSDKYLIKGLGG